MKEYTIKNVFEHPINQNDDFREVFNEFLDMRKKMKRPATERAVKLLILKLIDLSKSVTETTVYSTADPYTRMVDPGLTCWLSLGCSPTLIQTSSKQSLCLLAVFAAVFMCQKRYGQRQTQTGRRRLWKDCALTHVNVPYTPNVAISQLTIIKG